MRYPWVDARRWRWRLQGNATLGLRAGGRGHHLFVAARESAPAGSPDGPQKRTAAHARRHCKRGLAFSVLYRSGVAGETRPAISGRHAAIGWGMVSAAGRVVRRSASSCNAAAEDNLRIRSFETRISILVSRSSLLVSCVKTSAS